ncbi:MAG: trypsin-like peptidase domain-containing protein [Terracidiphilus sp.]
MHRASAAFFLSLVLPTAVMGQPHASQPSRQETVADVVRHSRDAVVQIVVSDQAGNEVSLGSGFIVSADGKVVTNYHVIQNAYSGVVKLANGSFFPVEGVLAVDTDKDLAILKVEGKKLPFLNIAPTLDLNVGDQVVAIGSPLGLEGTVSDGIVSALREEAPGKDWIQTTAPVSHGNSGGPLLNMRGNVVGVITWGISLQEGQNLNFAIPSEEVKSLLGKSTEVLPLNSLLSSAQPVTSQPSPASDQVTEEWADPVTGLVWSRKDNGIDVTWQQASDYCKGAGFAAHTDWRLPTVEELQSIYVAWDGEPDSWHTKGYLQFSGLEWSGSPGKDVGEASFFNLYVGLRGSAPIGRSAAYRALCVRGSAKTAEPVVKAKVDEQALQPVAEQPTTEKPANVEQSRTAQDVTAGLTWSDPETGLIWTKKDNGYGNDLTWQESVDYCRNLRLAGYTDWRLPTIDELQGIFDSTANEHGPTCYSGKETWHVKGSLQLSGSRYWSSSHGNAYGEMWSFDFTTWRRLYLFSIGHRFSTHADERYCNRALCVRRAGE